MGTRSTTRIRCKRDNQAPQTLLTFYRQMDGYPSGHGLALGEEIDSYVLVNGIGIGDGRKLANGAGCLAAQVLGYFKDGCAGGIYCVPDRGDEFDHDYHYDVTIHEKWGKNGLSNPTYKISVEVWHYGEADKPAFKGTLSRFIAWCKKDK